LTISFLEKGAYYLLAEIVITCGIAHQLLRETDVRYHKPPDIFRAGIEHMTQLGKTEGHGETCLNSLAQNSSGGAVHTGGDIHSNNIARGRVYKLYRSKIYPLQITA